MEAQQGNGHSLLWWMRRLIALRKQLRGFGRGTMEFLTPENRHVLAFLRTLRGRGRARGREPLAIRAIRRARPARYEGMVPVEMFGRTPVPADRREPYMLTLGPHAFYWFALQPQRPSATRSPRARCAAGAPCGRRMGASARSRGGAPNSRRCCSRFFARRRWFAGKERATRSSRGGGHEARRSDAVVRRARRRARSTTARASRSGTWSRWRCSRERGGRDARSARRTRSCAFVTRGRGARGRRRRARGAGVLPPLLEPSARRRRLREGQAQLASHPSRALRALLAAADDPARAGAPRRRADELLGRLRQPTDPEVLPPAAGGSQPRSRDRAALRERAASGTPPPLLGSLDLPSPCVPRGGTLAVLHGIVPNDRDAWSLHAGRARTLLRAALTDPRRRPRERRSRDRGRASRAGRRGSAPGGPRAGGRVPLGGAS